MIQLSSDEGSMDQVHQRAQSVEKDIAQWKITSEQKRSLFTTVARALDKINDIW